jgi:hypothetical protein
MPALSRQDQHEHHQVHRQQNAERRFEIGYPVPGNKKLRERQNEYREMKQ